MIIKYRLYSRATEGGGGVVTSTKSGGGTSRSTSSGGGTSRSTSSGGSTTRTSSAGGDHRHRMYAYIANAGSSHAPRRMYQPFGAGSAVYLESSLESDLYTEGSSGNHSHSVSIPAHTHEFTTPNHTHEFTTPAHTHDIDLPNHTHAVKHEIVELADLPDRVTIKVDGNTVPHTAIEGDRIDLLPYLAKDENGRIKRGRHEVTIQPNGLARVEADLIMRVFVQSHLGGAY